MSQGLHVLSLSILAAVVIGCGGAEPPAEAPVAGSSGAAPPPAPAPPVGTVRWTPPRPPPTPSAPALSPPIDEKAVAEATGADKPETSADGAVKASFPRKDVDVSVDGWKMPPFMGLTSWAAFSPGRAGVAEAMVMGDLVVLEDEVSPVMSKLLDAGLQVTGLHNHFVFDQPKVVFIHIGGEGKVADLGGGVRGALDTIAAIRKKTPRPATTSGAPKLPAKSALDGAALDAELDTKGQAKDGMYKAVWGREVTASCGCVVGKAMGVNTWAAFAGTADNAVVDGDFAVSEGELQSVLKTLRGGGIDVVAIHHHMNGEQPRLLFLHYWGRGKASALAATVKRAVDQTAWTGKATAT